MSPSPRPGCGPRHRPALATAARARPGLILGATLLAAGAVPAQARVSPDEAERALAAGNRRFAKGEVVPQAIGEGVRRTLAAGEAPWAIVVTTSDSRVAPEHIFNVGLGELFVVRVAGGVADPATIASIEYAAEHLGAPLGVVLAAKGSNGVANDDMALLPGAGGDSPALARIAARLRPAVQRAASEGLDGPALHARAAEENAHETVAECLRRSAVLRELTRLRQFRLAPALYALDTGEVTFLPARPPENGGDARDPAASRPRVATLPPHVALSLLQAGHRRFLAGTSGHADLSAPRRTGIALAQRPFAVVLADADSRMAPEHVFDVGLGDVAVVRVAGCALDDEVLGSIEHAVREFGIGLVLVLAPDRCGLTELLVEQRGSSRLTPSLKTVADWLEPSILEGQHLGRTGDDLVHAVVRSNVQRVVREARARSAILRRLEERGQLGMVAAVYRLIDGEIEWLSGGVSLPAAGARPSAPNAPSDLLTDAGHVPAPATTPEHDPPAAPAGETSPSRPTVQPAPVAREQTSVPATPSASSPWLVSLLALIAGIAMARLVVRSRAERAPS